MQGLMAQGPGGVVFGQSAPAGATAANGKDGGRTPGAYPLGRGSRRGPYRVQVWIHKAPDAPCFPGCFTRNRLREGEASCNQVVARSRFEPRSAWLHNQLFHRKGETGVPWLRPPWGAGIGHRVRAEEAARRARVQPPVVQPLPPVVMGARRRRRR